MEYKVNVILNDDTVEGLRLVPTDTNLQNEVFFKHENETEIDFFNKRVIPLLLEKGINLRDYYIPDNIEVIEEKDFVLKEKDNINITKKQIGNILTSQNLSDLNYDEQLYTSQVFRGYNQKKFSYTSDDNWNTSRNDILFEMCLEIDNPKSIDKVLPNYFSEEHTNKILKDLSVIAFNKAITYKWDSKRIESSLQDIQREKVTNIEKKIEEELNVNNTIIYENKCREVVLNETQVLLQESSYSYEFMYGASHVGKVRTNQEDSYIMLVHPKSKDFRLLAVADGMGGYKQGEIVSNHALKNLIKWFENEEISTLESADLTKQSIEEYLPKILEDLEEEKALNGGTTLASAVIGKTETLLINIGDSRVYTTKRERFIQETKDHSESQELYEEGRIVKKELMRFYKHNNRITKAITKNGPNTKADYKIISNSSYDKIILVTDGVSDCLSEEELKRLIMESKGNELAKNIVETALNKDSEIPKKYSYDHIYVKEIKGGKDNATALFYDAEAYQKEGKTR